MNKKYDKIIFTDERKKKEWEDLPKDVKDFTMHNLLAMTDKMENKISIETICHIVNELVERIEKLESESCKKNTES